MASARGHMNWDLFLSSWFAAGGAERSDQLAQVYRNKSRTVIVRAPGRFVSLGTVERAKKQEPEVATKTEPEIVLPTDTRVALIIGNSAYKGVSALRNPANDAAKVAEALKTLVFKSVDSVIDADRQTMITALQDFQAKADAADWSLVYFAGHGIEANGTFYCCAHCAHRKGATEIVDHA